MNVCTKYKNKVDRPRAAMNICTKYRNKVDRQSTETFFNVCRLLAVLSLLANNHISISYFDLYS